jgi:hypothetical protein
MKGFFGTICRQLSKKARPILEAFKVHEMGEVSGSAAK